MRQDLLLGQHPQTNSPSPFMNNVKSAMLADIPLDLSCHEFQQQVAGSCGVEADLQQFKAGFPPKKLDMQGQTIAELGISHGEALILERGTATRTIQSVHTSPADATPSSTSAALPSTADVAGRMPDGRAVVRRIIKADNSCLFNAVAYNLERTRAAAVRLRGVVKDTVKSDPMTFNDGVLGKKNEEYQRWIMDMDHWGGPIELFILAKHYCCEIAAFDIRTKRCDVYGQEEQYGSRCLVLYDGLHYDAMCIAAFPDAPEEVDCTVFDPAASDAQQIMKGAEDFVARLNAKRSFTDTANFTLRCGTCLVGLKGEKEAVEHAKSTGHANFQEYQ